MNFERFKSTRADIAKASVYAFGILGIASTCWNSFEANQNQEELEKYRAQVISPTILRTTTPHPASAEERENYNEVILESTPIFHNRPLFLTPDQAHYLELAAEVQDEYYNHRATAMLSGVAIVVAGAFAFTERGNYKKEQ